MYSEHFKQDLDDPNKMFPAVMCVTCKIWLEKVHGGNPKAGKLPKGFMWPVPIKNTRFSMCRASNPCIMCSEAYRFGRRNLAQPIIKHQSVGRPMENSPSGVIKRCNKCFQKIGRGITHNCSLSNSMDSLREHLGKRNLIDRFVSEDISKRLSLSNHSKIEINLPRPTGGHPFHLTATTSLTLPSIKSPMLTVSDIINIKAIGGISNNALKSISAYLKKKGFGAPSMEHYYKERYKFVGQFFECEKMQLNLSSKKSVISISLVWTAHCTDISGMFNMWINRSGDVDISLIKFKLGVDFGQEFLKVTLQPFGSNSVTDLVIIWQSRVPENYENLRTIFSSHEIRRLLLDYDVGLNLDLKAALMAFGIMQGRHPCVWCTWDERDNLDDYDRWELRGHTQHAQSYKELCGKYGGNRDFSKLCNGVENPSVFYNIGISPDENMALLNLPELHLMLGVGQRLYDQVFSSLSDPERIAHEKLLKRYHILKSNYHGGSFEGNSMRKILKFHREIFPNANTCAFIALSWFNSLVTSCFGQELKGDFERTLFEFEEAYKMCNISCTPKVHIVCRHIISFVYNYLPPGKGLGVVSEQALETSHHRFKDVWRRYKFSEDKEGYPQALLNALSDFNFVSMITPTGTIGWEDSDIDELPLDI